jgi:heterodisulfide reductase subunit B
VKLTFYPGCSLQATAFEYQDSTRAVFGHLGIDLVELEDWNCCGASCAHSTNHYLALALPLRNLVLAEKAKNDVVAPCAACYNLMKSTDHQMRQHTPEAERINAELETIMGARYGATITVRHPLEILSVKDMLRTISEKVVRPLTGLKLVTYYGCLLTRPKEVVAFDDPEQPVSMDKILTALGAEVRRWSYKIDCCGGSLALSNTPAVETLVAKLVNAAARAGAQAIVAACPLCLVTLDTRQNRAFSPMPIFYFTELMGLGFALPSVNEWLKRHITDPFPVFSGNYLERGVTSNATR